MSPVLTSGVTHLQGEGLQTRGKLSQTQVIFIGKSCPDSSPSRCRVWVKRLGQSTFVTGKEG